MELRFADPELERLYSDKKYMGKRGSNLVRAFRRRVFSMMAAPDERTFREDKGAHYEVVRARPGYYSMKLNDQYRIIFTYEGEAPKTIVIDAISDHYQP